MTEHRYVYDVEEGFFVDMAQPCPDDPNFGTELLTDEILKMLNEYETLKRTLSAEDARDDARILEEVAREYDGNLYIVDAIKVNKLLDYARILEGQDETE